jgi:hypothetical protein
MAKLCLSYLLVELRNLVLRTILKAGHFCFAGLSVYLK